MSALPQEINLDYDCTGLTVLHPDLFNTNADDIRESTWQKAILHWHWDLTLTWLATWSQLKLHYELYKWHLALLSPHLTRDLNNEILWNMEIHSSDSTIPYQTRFWQTDCWKIWLAAEKVCLPKYFVSWNFNCLWGNEKPMTNFVTKLVNSWVGA